jgi:hypothetical protein
LADRKQYTVAKGWFALRCAFFFFFEPARAGSLIHEHR